MKKKLVFPIILLLAFGLAKLVVDRIIPSAQVNATVIDQAWVNEHFQCGTDTAITIPEGVETIESYAFPYCDFLKHVTLPKSLKAISDGAFSLCRALTEINIPDGVETIGESAL